MPSPTWLHCDNRAAPARRSCHQPSTWRAPAASCLLPRQTQLRGGRRSCRRFEKEFKKMPKPDNCTICGTECAHNSRTFGGLCADSTIVLAGECCERSVVTPMVPGVYPTRAIDGLLPLANAGARKGGTSPENVERAIGAIRSHFGDLDSRTQALMQRGGIAAQAKNIFVADQPWKANDPAWFQDNPDRSHRLRPMLEGEVAPGRPKSQRQRFQRTIGWKSL